ncbi:hypothetical protein GCM10010462_08600 [Microbacterium dextranolyticum]|uniref:Uncharacterized protein n=1 Tax=Microbacterium dextranolyticum TaxID=36806 RepID=A0A9W6HPK2_9MICO|nr:hypothetical protein GCM10017591_23270 [Microbacterium dextranolyticum]
MTLIDETADPAERLTERLDQIGHGEPVGGVRRGGGIGHPSTIALSGDDRAPEPRRRRGEALRGLTASAP